MRGVYCIYIKKKVCKIGVIGIYLVTFVKYPLAPYNGTFVMSSCSR